MQRKIAGKATRVAVRARLTASRWSFSDLRDLPFRLFQVSPCASLELRALLLERLRADCRESRRASSRCDRRSFARASVGPSDIGFPTVCRSDRRLRRSAPQRRRLKRHSHRAAFTASSVKNRSASAVPSAALKQRLKPRRPAGNWPVGYRHRPASCAGSGGGRTASLPCHSRGTSSASGDAPHVITNSAFAPSRPLVDLERRPRIRR